MYAPNDSHSETGYVMHVPTLSLPVPPCRLEIWKRQRTACGSRHTFRNPNTSNHEHLNVYNIMLKSRSIESMRLSGSRPFHIPALSTNLNLFTDHLKSIFLKTQSSLKACLDIHENSKFFPLNDFHRVHHFYAFCIFVIRVPPVENRRYKRQHY